MKTKPADIQSNRPRPGRHFRAAVAQGLAALVPPLLTVLIVIWVINTTRQYVLEPVASGVREALVWATADIRQENVTPDKDGRITVRVTAVGANDAIIQAIEVL